MNATRGKVTKAELKRALDDACRLLVCYKRKLRDLGEVSQAEAIGRHLTTKCDLVRRVEAEEYADSIRR